MILLLGGNGYVGTAFARELTRRGSAFRILSRSELDYTDVGTLRDCLRDTGARFLINCAGYTGRPNVDACEYHKTDCLLGNAVLPGQIADACEAAKVPWGHVSSGCIYTGCRNDGEGFTEKDAPNFSFRKDNCSFYSGTKALGEEILAGREGVYLWRMRIPFNHEDGPRNYLSKMMRYERLLEATNSISHLADFVNTALACWDQQVPAGIYNVTNPGHITTRQVVERLQVAGLLKREVSFFDDEAEFMNTAAITPRSNCVLDSSKLATVGITLRPVEEALDESIRNWSAV